MLIEDKLNELPYFFQQKIQQKCECCGKTNITRFIQYELQIKILPNENGHRYLIYYKSNDSNMFFDSKYIGEHLGIGFKTLEKAMEDLKKYLPISNDVDEKDV